MHSSSTTKPNHLLLIFIKEPTEKQAKPHLTKDLDPAEAAVRYKTLCQTLLHQLIGLTDTHVRFCISPVDATEAVQFWLLPLLKGKIQQQDTHLFHYTPNAHTPPLYIEFCPNTSENHKTSILLQQKIGFQQNFTTVTTIGTHCPECGSRWINASRLLCKTEADITIGLCQNNTPYLTTVRKPTYLHPSQTLNSTLPKLTKVETHHDWLTLLDSPIGGKMRTQYNILTNKTI